MNNIDGGVQWKLLDIIMILIITTLIEVLPYLAFLQTLSKRGTAWSLYVISVNMVSIVVTYYWLKIRYGIGREALGLSKGLFSAGRQIRAGLLAAVFWVILIAVTGFLCTGLVSRNLEDGRLIVGLLGQPLTLYGLGGFVLAPIANEVFFRGLIFNYLLTRMKPVTALLIQAMVAAAFEALSAREFHAAGCTDRYFVFQVLFHLSLGGLYYKFKGLLSSACCNGLVHFALFFFGFVK